MTTSASGLIPTRDQECPKGHSWVQIRMGDKWAPERCSVCNPTFHEPKAKAGPQPFSGDILATLAEAGFNMRKYKDATLNNFDPDPDAHALDAAKEYVEAWRSQYGERYAQRDWMYLFGGGSKGDANGKVVEIGALGNGKTFLATAIARALIYEGLVHPKRVLFCTAESMLLEAEGTFRDGAKQSEAELMRHYAAPDLLVIDDVGVRHAPTPHAMRVFDEITKRREGNGTIWTSNLSLGLLARADEAMRRVVDRIVGEAGDGAKYVVRFDGPSWRQRRSQLQ